MRWDYMVIFSLNFHFRPKLNEGSWQVLKTTKSKTKCKHKRQTGHIPNHEFVIKLGLEHHRLGNCGVNERLAYLTQFMLLHTEQYLAHLLLFLTVLHKLVHRSACVYLCTVFNTTRCDDQCEALCMRGVYNMTHMAVCIRRANAYIVAQTYLCASPNDHTKCSLEIRLMVFHRVAWICDTLSRSMVLVHFFNLYIMLVMIHWWLDAQRAKGTSRSRKLFNQ